MSSEWKSYADFDRFGTEVRVHIGQFHGDVVDLVTFRGDVTMTTVGREETAETVQDPSLVIRADMAEALYLALDRIFGKHQSTEAADVLERALNYERSRVDGVLNALLRPAVVKEDPK